MNRTEFGTVAMALKTYYPRENLLPNDKAMDLWFRQLEDIPYNVAETAVNVWASTNKWSPAISEIREMCVNTMFGEPPQWSEGWEELQMAIRKYGMYDPDSAIESLSNTTKETVKRLGYRNLCVSENEVSDRAQFRQVFEAIAQNKHRERIIPKAIAEKTRQIKELYTPKVLELQE